MSDYSVGQYVKVIYEGKTSGNFENDQVGKSYITKITKILIGDDNNKLKMIMTESFGPNKTTHIYETYDIIEIIDIDEVQYQLMRE